MADGVIEQFKGIPMGELIGAPLTAACAAQYNLARTMTEFINEIGFEGDGKKARLLNMELQRMVEKADGTFEKEDVNVQAPVLGLVPIPALLIDLVTIDFTMEVKQSLTNKTATDAKASFEAKVGFAMWSASVQGSVSTHRENTRSTDNSAKYNVHVQARQQPPAEGMSKLMDLLSKSTDVIPATT